MHCIRKEMAAEIYPYEEGLEDGIRTYADVVTSGLVDTQNLYIINKLGVKVVPFVRNRRGCIFIKYGDYIIVDEDGTKHICGEDKIWDRYIKKEQAL